MGRAAYRRGVQARERRRHRERRMFVSMSSARPISERCCMLQPTSEQLTMRPTAQNGDAVTRVSLLPSHCSVA